MHEKPRRRLALIVTRNVIEGLGSAVQRQRGWRLQIAKAIENGRQFRSLLLSRLSREIQRKSQKTIKGSTRVKRCSKLEKFE